MGDPAAAWSLPTSEWDAFGLNYTSGTGGRPKGVVISHRGAYLMAMGTVPAWNVPMHPIYLYTVPLFHCNGWGHAWMNALVAGTIICLKKIEAATIFDVISKYRVTHFGGAPVVLSLLVNAPSEHKKQLRSSSARHDCWGAAATSDFGADRAVGLRSDASLWFDRNLRPHYALCLESKLGCAWIFRACRNQSASGGSVYPH